MNPVVIIPARLESLRLPKKILLDIHGIPMIEHVRRRVLLSKQVKDVFIATCDKEIKDALHPYGAKVIMTSNKHENGTSRVAEASLKINCDSVILVQGDEPLLLPNQLDLMYQYIYNDRKSYAWNATSPINNTKELLKRSFVKCLVNNSKILKCFRHPNDFNNFNLNKYEIRKILGLIAFKKDFLININKMKKGNVEIKDSIEQMRILENNHELVSVPFQETQDSINEPCDIDVVLDKLKSDEQQKILLNKVINFK